MKKIKIIAISIVALASTMTSLRSQNLSDARPFSIGYIIVSSDASRSGLPVGTRLFYKNSITIPPGFTYLPTKGGNPPIVSGPGYAVDTKHRYKPPFKL